MTSFGRNFCNHAYISSSVASQDPVDTMSCSPEIVEDNRSTIVKRAVKKEFYISEEMFATDQTGHGNEQ